MALSPGDRLGAYTVSGFVGAGGMGEVYRARDFRLNRDVALKVLPATLAHDEERIARFRREAQALAALSHPHIAGIYGVEESAGVSALVLEFVEGETLADRLLKDKGARGAPRALPIDEALSIARQIGLALEAAHRGGIVHRDLKPANIKVTREGAVKVLDFGLAKVAEPIRADSAVSQSPTITTPAMTQAGVILGTAAYMSPEQVKGLAADKRSDIWAFGCVLFEMLTGSRPFDAEDVAETLAAVLMREPDWTRLPSSVPQPIHTLLRRCLERDRTKRLTDMAAALFALDQAGDTPAAGGAGVAHSRRHIMYAGWGAAALVATVAAGIVIPVLRRVPPGPPTMRLQIVLPPGGDSASFALSPDGQSLVYHARSDGRYQLSLRRLETGEDRVLARTNSAATPYPFWSPDSQSVAFFSDGMLKRVDVASGFVRALATAPADARRGSWSRTGSILFGSSSGPLRRVPAEGGPVENVTTLLPGQSSHRHPHFLPDGRRFLLLALGENNVKGLYLASLDSKNITRLLDGEPAYAFYPPDRVVFARQGGLWAQRLNVEAARMEGQLEPIAPRVYVHPQVNGLGALSVSPAGLLAFRPAAATRQLVWLDRSGRQIGELGQPDESEIGWMRLSADGRSAVGRRSNEGNTDVWLLDTSRGVFRRITFDPSVDGAAVLSPDGSRIVYASDPKGTLWDIFERRADGTGESKLLVDSPDNDSPLDWSPDGRYVLYLRSTQQTGNDLWALAMDGDRPSAQRTFPLAQTTFDENDAQFSPDGHWIVFDSTETGRSEVYVQPFPGLAAKTQVSVAGGSAPRWPRGARELFYLAPDRRVMAVAIRTSATGVEAATPQGLLTLREDEEYEPSPDGQRFLVNRVVSGLPPLTILANWKPGR
jgi:eukaryotic-like serine/threonine-protein kinase